MSDAPKIQYPALYIGAGLASAKAQSKYLWLLRGEYICLIIAAILSLDLSDSRLYYLLFALIFLFSLGILICRSWLKPEQEWYKSRALAESIKTTTWRYIMRAAPFGDVPNVGIRRAEFRNHLKAVLDANRHIGERLPPDSAADDQITKSMELIRSYNLEQRKVFYLAQRIKDQRNWYSVKAAYNRKWERRWVLICALVYVLAILSVLLRIVFNEWKIWPTDILTVMASSIIGWIQIKKYNELASAYTLTAHEIGILQSKILEVSEEEQLSEFINEAELAFSREHTQWVARQHSS